MIQAYGSPLSPPSFLTFQLSYEIMEHYFSWTMKSLEHHLLGLLEIASNMKEKCYSK